MLKNRIANPYIRSLMEWLFAIGLAVLFFFAARTYVFRMAHVTGESMAPTLTHGEMVFINRLSLRFSSLRAGDVVAFPYRLDPSEFFIKRVVALPGDIVDLVDGAFWINGALLADDFSREPLVLTGDAPFPFVVPEGSYFVLGDNRNGSKDSRFTAVGCVPAKDMVGRVAIRVWPLRAFGRI